MPPEKDSTRSSPRSAEVDEREHLPDALAQELAVEPVETADELHVLAGGEIGVERHVLGHVADARLGRERALGDLEVADVHAARVALQEPAHHADRRRLPGAVRSEQPVGLAARDREAHVVDRDPVAESAREVLAAQDNVHRDHPGSRASRRAGPKGPDPTA